MAEPRAFTLEERPDLVTRLSELSDDGSWPEFALHSNVALELWKELRSQFLGFQWVLLDEERDQVIGMGYSAPVAWDGSVEHLPGGFDDVLRTSLLQLAEGVRPNTLSALMATITPSRRGEGLSGLLIQTMRRVAGAHGFDHLIAPVRPTWKERYPLMPIERYVTWRRDDGLPFDPWIRLHERLGGRILAPCPDSTLFSATVAEWESWTKMAFPEDGDYVIPGALSLLHIDHERDLGVHVEPNVWVRHDPLRS